MTGGIVTVTLNAAIDKTYYLPGWAHGTVMRADRVIQAAGGKGINVARVLHQLGHEQITASGFIAGYNGLFIRNKTEEAGLTAGFVEVQGESRLCLNFIDGRVQSSTEVLEPGPVVTEADRAAMKVQLRLLASEAKLVILSGSLPRGCPAEYYAELIAVVRSAGAEAFLDASGMALSEGLKERPAFIKPNEDEIRPWMSGEQSGENGIREAIASLASQGVAGVAVTLGSAGAIARVDGGLYRLHIPRVEAVNAVGCGDAFVAGYAYGYVRGWKPEQSLRYAAAAGSANALTASAGEVNLADHARLLGDIVVEQIA